MAKKNKPAKKTKANLAQANTSPSTGSTNKALTAKGNSLKESVKELETGEFKETEAETTERVTVTDDTKGDIVSGKDTHKANSLGRVAMVLSKSGAQGCALLSPQITTIEGYKFIAGSQCTGRPGHRMEGKHTLIPLDHVASIVQFDNEEDLWSDPQPRHLRLADEQPVNNIPLTSHEHGRPNDRQKPHGHRHGRHGDRHGKRHGHRHGDRHAERHGNRHSTPDAQFQERHDFGRDRDFNR